MLKNSTYSWCFVNKMLTGAIVFAICLETMAQTPAVFNFENATKVSELPEQPATSNTPPPSMQKRYYLDPSLQLFTASELKYAYEQMNGLRGFYSTSRNAVALWEQTRNLLFSDRAQSQLDCENLSKSILRGKTADSKINYKSKLEEAFGADLYSHLQFCINYLGLSYTDWELWEAYAASRTALINEVKTLPGLSSRTMAFVLAVDIKYTLCIAQHPDITCLSSAQAINQTGR